MLKRRLLAAQLGSSLLLLAQRAAAQQQARVPRIGWLAFLSPDRTEVHGPLTSFWEGMKEQGFVEGRNVAVEYRWAQGVLARNPELASDLVRLGVDLIVAGNTGAAHAARAATRTIPIVCFNLGSPVAEGFAVSLARPGGNVTGITILAPELVPKQLSLLKEAVPRASRIAGLWQPGMLTESGTNEMLDSTRKAAQALGADLRLHPVRSAEDMPGALSAIAGDGPEALLIMPSPVSLFQREQIGAFIAAHRLPTIGWIREFVQVGALMSYGVDFNHQYRRGATYVAKILKGADPATLPIEQPTRFELVVNLRAARTLGIAISPVLSAQANDVVD